MSITHPNDSLIRVPEKAGRAAAGTFMVADSPQGTDFLPATTASEPTIRVAGRRDGTNICTTTGTESRSVTGSLGGAVVGQLDQVAVGVPEIHRADGAEGAGAQHGSFHDFDAEVL